MSIKYKYYKYKSIERGAAVSDNGLGPGNGVYKIVS